MAQSFIKKLISKISYVKFTVSGKTEVNKSVLLVRILNRLRKMDYLDLRSGGDYITFNNYNNKSVVTKSKYAQKLQTGVFELKQAEDGSIFLLTYFVSVLSEVLLVTAGLVFALFGVYFITAILWGGVIIRLIIKFNKLKRLAKILVIDICESINQWHKSLKMGSQLKQAALWGQRPEDWATIQEPTGNAGYEFALSKLNLTNKNNLLDIGCGSGLFCSMVDETGATAIGLDATGELLDEARKRLPQMIFVTGEMEQLPFEDNEFTVVTGFNSFQYAENTKNALTEAKRVLKPGGKLAAMIWGNKEDCEAATYLKAVGSMLPPPPPGAPGPFALTENHLLESILEEIGFKILNNTDVSSVWDYPDMDTALRGLLSVGPAAKAIENSGYDKVHETVLAAVQPYVQGNGHVVYKNKFRVVIAEK